MVSPFQTKYTSLLFAQELVPAHEKAEVQTVEPFVEYFAFIAYFDNETKCQAGQGLRAHICEIDMFY